MSRIEGISRESASTVAVDSFDRVERALGRIPEPLRVTAHSDAILQAYMGFERYLAKASRLPVKLKSLVNLKAAALIGCPF